MENLFELDKTEAQNIDGGSADTWKWTGKVIGAIMEFFADVSDSYSYSAEGKAVQQALLDFQ